MFVKYVGYARMPLSRQAIEFLISEGCGISQLKNNLDIETAEASTVFIAGGKFRLGRHFYVFPNGMEKRLNFAIQRGIYVPPCALPAKNLISIRYPQGCSRDQPEIYRGPAYEEFCEALQRLHGEELKRCGRRTKKSEGAAAEEALLYDPIDELERMTG